jgi:hypothetical protein
MSILFMNGFEAGVEVNRWDTWATDPSRLDTLYGRLSSIGCWAGDSGGNWAIKGLNLSDDTLAYSFAIQILDIGDADTVIQGAFGTNKHITWRTGDQIGIENAPSDYVSTAGTFTKDAWHWVEAEIFYHASAGTVKTWINGTLVIDESGLNTGSRPASVSFMIGGSQVTHILNGYYDDIIVTDGAGSYNNTRPIGDSQIVALFPSEDGNVSGLTGSDADQIDNFLLVDENPEPNTTDYCESSTEGDKDLYLLDDLPNTDGSILGIQVEHYATKDDSGSKFGRSVIRTNSIDYPQTTVGLSTSTYEINEIIVEENPDTTSAWTPAEINALEAGFEVRDS